MSSCPPSSAFLSLRKCLLVLSLSGLVVALSSARADEPDADSPSGEKEAHKDLPIPKESASVTHHTMTLDGVEIAYTATAGTLHVQKGEDTVASVFYVAYTRDDAKAAARRPVTFFYNGGPGSASVWLHMGAFGPRKVVSANAAPTGPAPFTLADNPYSLLDKSDLVFIDAVGTGFSRIAGKGKPKDFFGVDQDIEAFGKFITRYVTVNHRWNSPKFLFGESYGTLRSAGLVYYLQQQGMDFNGVVLLSSVLNYVTLTSMVLDEPYENLLPTFAAVANAHDKLPEKPANLKDFLQTVRDFATGEYAQALSKGADLPPAQADAVAAKLHLYTGLSVRFIKESNLRVSAARFRKELLRDERRTVGRYDGRFEGIDFDAAGEDSSYDPASAGPRGAFVALFGNYVTEDLGYAHEQPYYLRAPELKVADWDLKHKTPEGNSIPWANVIGDLSQAMRENPHLHVMSANGYYDLATPFLGTERDLNHMQLDPSLRKNLEITYYPSGHMVYLNPEAHKAFKADLAAFYDAALAP